MTTGKIFNGWILVAVFLVVIIAAGGIFVRSKYSRSQAIEISMVPESELPGEIYIDGEVNNPGLYPLGAEDSIKNIIRAAGGTTDGADLTQLKLHVPGVSEEKLPQKVNINRAEVWLLEALPGIGEVRAKAIISYRQQHGPFHSTDELLQVEGIGTAIYEQIKDLITVTDQ